MKASRLTYNFLNGARSFIDYVKQTLGDMAYFPCNKCRNANGNPNESLITQHDGIERPRMFDLVDDAFGYIQSEDLNEGTQDGSYKGVDEFSEEEIEYQKLKDDASRPLYPSCSPADIMMSVTIQNPNAKEEDSALMHVCYISMHSLVKEIIEKNPQSKYNDVDHDHLAQVLGKESYIDLKNWFSQYKAKNDVKLDSLRDMVTSLRLFERAMTPTVNVDRSRVLPVVGFLTFLDARKGLKMLPILGSVIPYFYGYL
ncbi:hypothetical protein GIB67_010473 [Kingdonia uniflora]|uniref:Transposase-associated domain-containing protein n=1 Tax=Kingdonia uniflora TaxID=39325 RepID=A0A7J7MAJ8_9MAGN|nr:hypothetical protein GIB67_010473 [Kingdonia uniflora]